MHAVLESVTQMILPQATEKRIALEVSDCPPEIVARADRSKVEQIILNLVTNAVKFTEPGGRVTITCRPDDGGAVACAVADTGIGIPADHLEQVFEPFIQVGRSLTKTQEGTGLGLAISRDLARAMHGDIVAESVPDQGSVFTLSLPAAAF
jgi:signal transduction histidine kinase